MRTRTTAMAAALALGAAVLAGCSTPTADAGHSPRPVGFADHADVLDTTPSPPWPVEDDDPEPEVEPDVAADGPPMEDAPEPLDAAATEALPLINPSDATGVHVALPVDPDPSGDVGTERIRLSDAVVAYASPGGEPIGRLGEVTVWDWTTAPVFERRGEWVMVPVMARAGLPSGGVTGQAVVWLHTGDPGIATYTDDRQVVVDLDAGTLTVEVGGGVVASETVGIGASGTPTPTGRTSVASIYTDPEAAYTRGHEILAWTRFSDVQDRFRPLGTARGTRAAPLIAFHVYEDSTSGAVSNGCVRVSPGLIDALVMHAPAGTPVIVR